LNGNKLRKTTWQEIDLFDPNKDVAGPAGVPDYYHREGNQIYLYPIPSASATGGLKVYYSRCPAPVAVDADTPEIPLSMHEDLVLRVIAKGHEQVEDFVASQNKLAEYDKAVTLSQEQAQEGTDEVYPSVRDTEIAIWSGQ
jgi:hypothetical protein